MNVSAFPDTPMYVTSGAAYPATLSKMEALTLKSRFDDEIMLYKPIGGPGGGIFVPRNLAPNPPQGKDFRDEGVLVDLNSTLVPRNDDQVKILSEAGELLTKGRSFIIEASTGKGKTVLACDLAAKQGRRFAVVVHKSDLANQWRKAMKGVLGLEDHEIGIVKGDTVQTEGKKAVIFMVQSCAKEGRYPSAIYRGFGLVIFDEVHHMGADKFSQAIWNFPAKLRLGLSATVDRKDGREVVFKSHIGPIMVRCVDLDLVPKVLLKETGWKLPRRTKKTAEGRKVTQKMPVKAGRTGRAERIMGGNVGRNTLIADLGYRAYKKGRNVVIIASQIGHLEALADMLYGRGVRIKDLGYYIGGLKESEQEEAKAKQVVLATYAMCNDGTDAPWWDMMIFATPRADVQQTAGRILREYPDKPLPVLVDLIDSDCPVYDRYAASRRKWYKKIGAEIVALH